VLWTTLPVGMVRAGLGVGDDRPISYLGTDPRGIVLFRLGLLVAALGFSIFAVEVFAVEVGRRLAQPASFLVVFLGGQACQVVVALVSIAGRGTTHTVHTAAGILLGLSLPLLIWRYAAAQPPGRWRELTYGLMALEVGGCVLGVALSVAGRAVVAEVAPAIVFHLWVVVVTLLGPEWRSGPGAGVVGSAT